MHDVRTRPKAVPALAAWRTLDPDAVRPRTLRSVRTALHGTVQMHDRRWPAARAGNAAAAVGVALRFLAEFEPDGPDADLVMSALLVCAAEGDPAAACVLAHALRGLSHGRPDGADLLARGRLWAERRAD